MFYIVDRDYATLILDSSTILMILGIIRMSFRHREKNRPDLDSFVLLLVINIIMALGDTLGYLCEYKVFPHSRGLATLGMTIFYTGFVVITMAWLHYCRVRFRGDKLSDRTHFAYEYIPGMIMTVLVLINVFTGWIFSYNEKAEYFRGVLFIPMYILLACYIAAGFMCVAKYRDNNSGRALIPIWVYAIPILIGGTFTFFVPGSASFAPFGIAMSFVFTHMGTINEVS